VFLIDSPSHEIDNCNVMSGLASGTKSIAEHESQGRLQHCLVRLLQACLFIKSQYFASRSELLVGACDEAFDLCPVDDVRF